jgi:cytidine deaminase
VDWEPLVAAATAARERAYAPYSGFPVGAALLAEDGRIFSGCNVENRSFGLAICAERAALVEAVRQGARRFAAVAVVTDLSPPAPPCGLCRESLSEFADDLPVLLLNPRGERQETTLRRLFPQPFAHPGAPRDFGRGGP